MTETRADELMIMTMVHDHTEREHSYRLIAGAFGLEGDPREP
ncbi:MAG: hypothetical protein R2878_02725 [Thermoleophilia bacterium]